MNDAAGLQRDVTRLALHALDGTEFALAGSGAIREYGIIDRPTEDVDLFTTNTNVTDFDGAVALVVDGLRDNGYLVDEGRRADRFARLHASTPAGEHIDIDMGVDWREAVPVVLAVGPVLSLEDAVGNKISALYSRGEARDYLDVDAIRASGRFTDTQLLAAAHERDAGFEIPMLVQQLNQVTRIQPEHVADYGVDAEQLEAVKTRFTQWADHLSSPQPRSNVPLEQLLELRRAQD